MCWQIIKVDIMAAMSAVWTRKFGNFHLLNSAYITLLPKKEDATSVKDYEPISLVHSFAKLLTKLMANSLVHVGPPVGGGRRRGREEAGGAVATSLVRVGGSGGRRRRRRGRRRSQGRREMAGERRRKSSAMCFSSLAYAGNRIPRDHCE